VLGHGVWLPVICGASSVRRGRATLSAAPRVAAGRPRGVTIAA
jgi:hypothetical protein